jgi:hypothetical protein
VAFPSPTELFVLLHFFKSSHVSLPCRSFMFQKYIIIIRLVSVIPEQWFLVQMKSQKFPFINLLFSPDSIV